jgi:methylmalonyl-CoA mutase N-terminal domain/subunit
VADPLGGSWYLESLTGQLEHRIREMIERIEAMGPPEGLCDGRWFRALFLDAMERRATQLNAGRLVQVGVNAQQMPEVEDTLLRDVTERKIAPAAPRIERLRALRRERDAGLVTSALRAVCGAAEDRAAHLMPPLIAATEAGATIGEMAGALRAGYGRPPDPFGMVTLPW